MKGSVLYNVPYPNSLLGAFLDILVHVLVSVIKSREK